MKNQWCTLLGCKDVGIKKSDFVAKTQFLTSDYLKLKIHLEESYIGADPFIGNTIDQQIYYLDQGNYNSDQGNYNLDQGNYNFDQGNYRIDKQNYRLDHGNYRTFGNFRHPQEAIRSDSITSIQSEPSAQVSNRKPLKIEPFLPLTQLDTLIDDSFKFKPRSLTKPPGLVVTPSPSDLAVHEAVPGRPVVSFLQPRVHSRGESTVTSEFKPTSEPIVPSSSLSLETIPKPVNISSSLPIMKPVVAIPPVMDLIESSSRIESKIASADLENIYPTYRYDPQLYSKTPKYRYDPTLPNLTYNHMEISNEPRDELDQEFSSEQFQDTAQPDYNPVDPLLQQNHDQPDYNPVHPLLQQNHDQPDYNPVNPLLHQNHDQPDYNPIHPVLQLQKQDQPDYELVHPVHQPNHDQSDDKPVNPVLQQNHDQPDYELARPILQPNYDQRDYKSVHPVLQPNQDQPDYELVHPVLQPNHDQPDYELAHALHYPCQQVQVIS